MLIDTHCHLEDLGVLERARQAGVARLINIGCDIETTQKARDFGMNQADVFFSAGVHPHEASKAEPDYLERLREFAADPKCVAIGECGLDYYYNHSDRESQKRVFEAQIALAGELSKPLVVHVRDAYEDCLGFLDPLVSPTIIHCFSGDRAHAKAFLELGCYLSISGIVTFKNAEELRAVVVETPLERLLIETDAPYLAPMPYRGKPNESAYIVLVAQKIAELKSISIEEVIAQTGKNALHIFKLSV
ncbi:MAG: TatD family hydrolase [Myxococcaceae bacterium]